MTAALPPTAPLTLTALRHAPDCSWPVPGSKSLTNRAFILAALAEGCSILEGVLHSDDTRHMRNALSALGIEFTDITDSSVAVSGGRSRLHAPDAPLFIGNSGTSVRFLSALACHVPGVVTLTGDQHMALRPIADLVDGLRQMGVTVDCPSNCPPLSIHGGAFPGGAVHMDGTRSSQYFSALLLVAALGNDTLNIHIDGTLVSRPYVRMTIEMLRDFGVQVDETDSGFFVHRCTSYRNRSYQIEPDASSASYPFALAAATGGHIRVPHLTAATLQGDYQFLDVLERMGARIERTPHYTSVYGPSQLSGIDIDMHHISDTVMTLAAIAPLCSGVVHIRNIANIRIKETDRLAACVQELQKLGQGVEFGDDWLRITPQPITPCTIHCYSDHRMAMSFAVLAAVHGGICIEDPACVSKTYPSFWDDIDAVYAAQNDTDTDKAAP